MPPTFSLSSVAIFTLMALMISFIMTSVKSTSRCLIFGQDHSIKLNYSEKKLILELMLQEKKRSIYADNSSTMCFEALCWFCDIYLATFALSDMKFTHPISPRLFEGLCFRVARMVRHFLLWCIVVSIPLRHHDIYDKFRASRRWLEFSLF